MSVVDEIKYDELFVEGFPIQTEQIQGKDAIALLKGTVVGLVTATGRFAAYDSGNVDGTEDIYGVLTVDYDNTAPVDSSAAIAISGAFNEDNLIFDGSDTKITTKKEARPLGLYWKTSLAA